MSGWIRINRKLFTSDMWLGEPFSRGQAWVDLINLANHKLGFIRVAGDKITIKRGQCGWSQLKLSQRWNWSRGKTRRFLNELELDEMIKQETNTRTTIITICNYNTYQGRDTTGDTTGSTTSDTTDGHQTDTNKEGKELKKEKIRGKIQKTTLPDFITWQDWNDFREMRNKIKQPMTDNAEKRMIDRLTKFNQQGYDVSKILNQSIINNWKDVYEPKGEQLTEKRKVAVK